MSLCSMPSLMTTVGRWSPTSISGGGPMGNLLIWLTSDSFVLNDGDNVTAWVARIENISPDGWATFTSGGSSYPIFKTNILNGYPVVRFDGTGNTWLTRTGSIATQPNTLFVVGKQSDKTTPGRFIDSFGFNRQFLGLTITNGYFDCYAGTEITDSTDHSGAFHCFSMIFNGASSFGYVDGTQVVSGNAGTKDMGETSVFIGSDGSGGANSGLNGDIAEILSYDRLLTTSERQQVEGYLKSKYKL